MTHFNKQVLIMYEYCYLPAISSWSISLLSIVTSTYVFIIIFETVLIAYVNKTRFFVITRVATTHKLNVLGNTDSITMLFT